MPSLAPPLSAATAPAAVTPPSLPAAAAFPAAAAPSAATPTPFPASTSLPYSFPPTATPSSAAALLATAVLFAAAAALSAAAPALSAGAALPAGFRFPTAAPCPAGAAFSFLLRRLAFRRRLAVFSFTFWQILFRLLRLCPLRLFCSFFVVRRLGRFLFFRLLPRTSRAAFNLGRFLFFRLFPGTSGAAFSLGRLRYFGGTPLFARWLFPRSEGARFYLGFRSHHKIAPFHVAKNSRAPARRVAGRPHQICHGTHVLADCVLTFCQGGDEALLETIVEVVQVDKCLDIVLMPELQARLLE